MGEKREPTAEQIEAGKRIAAARERAGLNQSEVARHLGISPQSVQHWEAGRTLPRAEKLTRLARIIKTTVSALTGDDKRVLNRAVESLDDLLAVPDEAVFPTRPAPAVPVIGKTMGGVPDRVWNDEGRPTGVTDEYAFVHTTDPNAFLVRVEGDSMAPKYDPGQYALVEPNVTPELEDDVLVRLTDGRTLLKRLASRKGGIRLSSVNPMHPVITVREEELVWMYYVAHPVPSRRIKSRL